MEKVGDGGGGSDGSGDGENNCRYNGAAIRIRDSSWGFDLTINDRTFNMVESTVDDWNTYWSDHPHLSINIPNSFQQYMTITAKVPNSPPYNIHWKSSGAVLVKLETDAIVFPEMLEFNLGGSLENFCFKYVENFDMETPTISCVGTNTFIEFPSITGNWDLDINGVFHDTGDDFRTYINVLMRDYLVIVTNGNLVRFVNESNIDLNIKLIPKGDTSYQEPNNEVNLGHNPSFNVTDEGLQFCLAPYIPPIEEPVWDIKYLVNGSWIYESTGSIVEQNADRNMYKNGATALVIADTVTTLGSGVFGNWNALTSVELGQSVRSIGNSAFAFCSNLTEFKCPNSLESLGYSALNSCTKLRLLEFGTNLISIGASACISCYVLETVVFRARNMPTVGQYAFGNGGSGSPNASAVYVPDDLFNEYAEAIWNLADISKFRSLSTYEP